MTAHPEEYNRREGERAYRKALLSIDRFSASITRWNETRKSDELIEQWDQARRALPVAMSPSLSPEGTPYEIVARLPLDAYDLRSLGAQVPEKQGELIITCPEFQEYEDPFKPEPQGIALFTMNAIADHRDAMGEQRTSRPILSASFPTLADKERIYAQVNLTRDPTRIIEGAVSDMHFAEAVNILGSLTGLFVAKAPR